MRSGTRSAHYTRISCTVGSLVAHKGLLHQESVVGGYYARTCQRLELRRYAQLLWAGVMCLWQLTSFRYPSAKIKRDKICS